MAMREEEFVPSGVLVFAMTAPPPPETSSAGWKNTTRRPEKSLSLTASSVASPHVSGCRGQPYRSRRPDRDNAVLGAATVCLLYRDSSVRVLTM